MNHIPGHFYLIEMDIDVNIFANIVGNLYEGYKAMGIDPEAAAAYIRGITDYMTEEKIQEPEEINVIN